MVGVNKPIRKTGDSAQNAPKRRPRNTELNSSKRKTGQQALAELRKQKLNCSAGRIPNELKPYYQEITQDEFAKIVGADPAALSGIISDIENEYGEKIVGYVTCKPEYEAAFLDAGIDTGLITESGKVLNGVDDGYISGSAVDYAAAHVDDPDLSSSTDESVNCSRWDWDRWDNFTVPAGEDVVDAVKAAMTDYDSNYTVEKVLVPNKSGIRDYLGKQGISALIFAKSDAYSEPDDEIILGWDGSDIDDSSPYNLADILDKSVGLGSDEADVDSSKEQSMNCSNESAADTSLDKALEFLNAGNVPEIQNARVFDNDGQIMVLYPDSESGKYMLMEATVTGEPTSGDKVMEDYQKSTGSLDSSKDQSMNCSEGDVVTITTESGNEVPLSEVKVIQNPSTNELMLYVPENSDDEIPEGFTVVYDVVQQGDEPTPDPDDTDDGEDEAKLDSSRQNRAARRRSRKLNSSKKKN